MVLINPFSRETLQEDETGLFNQNGILVYPKEKGAFQIEIEKNYASNFGFKWNLFHQTQLDSFSGTNTSKKRLFATTAWKRDMRERISWKSDAESEDLPNWF